MKNTIIKLVEPKHFAKFENQLEPGQDEVLVRPEYLSICAADQRYYSGRRDKESLEKKLPMALIHEAWGTVVENAEGLRAGDKVLFVPNITHEKNDMIGENYLYSSQFCASSRDGFMQKYIVLPRENAVKFENIDPCVAAVCELFSVAVHSVETFLSRSHYLRDTIGVWGDGNLGYLTALVLRQKLPESKITVFGIDPDKLSKFGFGVQARNVNSITEADKIDHAFECVGGSITGSVINQIIDLINPEGTIMLMGVSEKFVSLNTRMILEKGLSLIGRSRSGKQDFIETVKMLDWNAPLQNEIGKIIHTVCEVSGPGDASDAFDSDQKHGFKTVMKCNI